jgi:hypothetical protein
MKKKIIPFGWLPASWGLRGKTRERAEAEYYLDGHELDAKLVDIDHEVGTKDHAKAKARVDLKYKKTDEFEYDKRIVEIEHAGDTKALAVELLKVQHKHLKVDDFEYDKRLVEIDYAGDQKALAIELLRVHHKHGKISDYDFAVTSAELTLTGDELAIRKLEIDYAADKISKNTYEKAVANIKKEPFITILDSDYDPKEGVDGLFFEFDWNEAWIVLLQQHGYHGLTEDEIVKQWFEDLCRSVIHENMQDDVVPFNSGRIINQVRGKDGRHSDFS